MKKVWFEKNPNIGKIRQYWGFFRYELIFLYGIRSSDGIDAGPERA